MGSRLKFVVGDTRPPVVVQLTDNGVVIDVSSATVVLKFREAGTTTLLLTITGELLPGTLEADGITPDLTQYPTPGSGGRVQFVFPPGALDLDPGYYEGEIEATFPAGIVHTVYHKIKFALREQF
jgi:hypothetical protein